MDGNIPLLCWWRYKPIVAAISNAIKVYSQNIASHQMQTIHNYCNVKTNWKTLNRIHNRMKCVCLLLFGEWIGNMLWIARSDRHIVSHVFIIIILIAIVIGHRSKRHFGFVFVCSIYEPRKNCARLFILCACSIFYVYPEHTARVTCSSVTFISFSQRVRWNEEKDNNIVNTCIRTRAADRQASCRVGRKIYNLERWLTSRGNLNTLRQIEQIHLHFTSSASVSMLLATTSDFSLPHKLTHTRPEQCDLDAIISYLYILFQEKHARAR